MSLDCPGRFMSKSKSINFEEFECQQLKSLKSQHFKKSKISFV